MEITNAVSI